jgi:hypothetical protein
MGEIQETAKGQGVAPTRCSSRTWRVPPTDPDVPGAYAVTDETLPYHLLGFHCRLSQCLNPKTILICNLYSLARRSLVIRWISTVTSGTGGVMPFNSRNSNRTDIGSGSSQFGDDGSLDDLLRFGSVVADT